MVRKNLGVAHQQVRVRPQVEATAASRRTRCAGLVVLDRAVGYSNQPGVANAIGRMDSSAIIVDGGIVGNRAVGYDQVPCAVCLPVESTTASEGIVPIADCQVGEVGIKGPWN